MSKKLVTAQYGGSTEEFCSEECRSRYTMLFCHVRLNAVIKVIVTLKKVMMILFCPRINIYTLFSLRSPSATPAGAKGN
ncbi:hypothetical protein [Streptococcus pyogenes]|uniref:hypothetical protein n=1 Tax=Streptococcus pyogenes TaxID=1314 RepID=UPI003DA07240